jgi:hypothetical protein
LLEMGIAHTHELSPIFLKKETEVSASVTQSPERGEACVLLGAISQAETLVHTD